MKSGPAGHVSSLGTAAKRSGAHRVYRADSGTGFGVLGAPTRQRSNKSAAERTDQKIYNA